MKINIQVEDESPSGGYFYVLYSGNGNNVKKDGFILIEISILNKLSSCFIRKLMK